MNHFTDSYFVLLFLLFLVITSNSGLRHLQVPTTWTVLEIGSVLCHVSQARIFWQYNNTYISFSLSHLVGRTDCRSSFLELLFLKFSNGSLSSIAGDSWPNLVYSIQESLGRVTHIHIWNLICTQISHFTKIFQYSQI